MSVWSAQGARPVRRSGAVEALASDAGAGKPEPGRVDLRGVVAVVPGEAGIDGDAGVAGRRLPRGWGRRARGRSGAQEVVGLGEQGERRSPVGVGVDEVQDALLDGIREVVGDRLACPRDVGGPGGVGVVGLKARHVALERPGERVGGTRVAVDVEVRRRVVLQGERGGVALLGGQQAGEVGVQLAELAGGVAAGVARRAGGPGARGGDRPAHVGAGDTNRLLAGVIPSAARRWKNVVNAAS